MNGKSIDLNILGIKDIKNTLVIIFIINDDS